MQAGLSKYQGQEISQRGYSSMIPVEIAPDIYWIAVNDRITDLFEGSPVRPACFIFKWLDCNTKTEIDARVCGGLSFAPYWFAHSVLVGDN
jgi:hypothetical protein